MEDWGVAGMFRGHPSPLSKLRKTTLLDIFMWTKALLSPGVSFGNEHMSTRTDGGKRKLLDNN